MKTFKNYLLTGGLFCVALALPCRSAAAPGQTSHFKFAGLTASAFFDSFDPTGCVETSASVFAISDRTQTMGRPEATPTAFVSLFQADNCTFTLLVSAFGSADFGAGFIAARAARSFHRPHERSARGVKLDIGASPQLCFVRAIRVRFGKFGGRYRNCMDEPLALT